MAEVGSLFVRLRADASEFEQTMSGISGDIENAGSKMRGTGKDLTKSVTAPLVGVAGAALGVGLGFDDGMAKVRAISGATGEDFDLLRDTAMELGSTTRFSASEAANGLEFLALAGWDANEMADGLGGVLSLASASGMDLGRTADIVTDTMSAFGIEASDSGKVADMFATASANSNTSVDQLGSALGRAGPTLAAMGIGLDETQTALGLMADQGLKGGRAGTALQAVMRDLTANAEDGTVSFGDFDVALYDAEGNMREFEDILGDVEGGLEGMTQEQRQAALSSVFQQQALQGINPLLSEGSERYGELRDSIVDSEGASGRMSETMEDTLGGSLRALKSQFEGILITLSDELVPVIRETVVPLIERFGEILSQLIEWFSNLDSRTQTIILAVLGFAAALGPVLVAVGTLMIVLAPVVGLIGALISPIGLVVLAIGLLAAGFYLAYTRSETFRNIVDTVVSFIRDVAVKAFELISARLSEFADNVLPELIAAFENVRDKVETAVNFLWDNLIEPVFSAIGDFISDHADTIKSVLNDAWEIIKSGISTAVDIIEGIIVAFLKVLQGDWEGAWDAVKEVIDSVWDHVKTTLQTMVDWVVGIFKWLWNQLVGNSIIPDMISDIISAVTGLKDDFVDLIQELVDRVVQFFTDLYNDVTSFVSDLVSETWDTISQWVADVIGAAEDLYNDVTEWVSELVTDVVQFYVDLARDAWEAFSGMVTDIVDSAKELVTDVMAEIESLPGRILDVFKDAGTWLLKAGKDIIGGLVSGIKDAIPSVDDVLGGVTDKIPDWKGPPVKDEKLLAPAGELIMQGLEGGIEKRASDVQRTLSRLTSDISATGTASAGGSNGMARSANSGNGTIVIHNEMGGEHIETLILDVLSGQMRKVH